MYMPFCNNSVNLLVQMDGYNDTLIESSSHLTSRDENGNPYKVIYRLQPFKNHNATSFHLPLGRYVFLNVLPNLSLNLYISTNLLL